MRIEMKRALLIVLMMIFSTAAGCLGEDGEEIITDDIDDIIDQVDNNTTTDNTTNTTAPTDADNDGVIDLNDTCPNTPTTDVVNANGCTIIPDTDGDGIADDVDECPSTQTGTGVDNVGCPAPDAIEVSIGLLSPQSGELSEFSESIERAANLAVNRMNDGQFVYNFERCNPHHCAASSIREGRKI